MKRVFPAGWFLAAALAVPPALSALGAAGVTNTAVWQNYAPADLQSYVSAAADRAEQITTGMNTLLTLNQSLQYQVRAAQALAEGSWDGFVEFFDYQTAAIAGYSQSLADLNEITDMFTKYNKETGDFEDVFTSETYKDLKTRAANMSRAMDAANEMVRATDGLVEQSERSARMIERGLRSASNASNPLQALQGQAMIFSAIAGESQASSRLLQTQLTYLKTLERNREETAKIDGQRADSFMRPREARDPDNPYRRTEASDRIRESLDGRYLDGAGSPRN